LILDHPNALDSSPDHAMRKLVEAVHCRQALSSTLVYYSLKEPHVKDFYLEGSQT